MYYVLLSETIDRNSVLSKLKNKGIISVFHYIPLHSSPAGLRYSKTHGPMDVTNRQSERLIRLPLWIGLSPEQQLNVINELTYAIKESLL